MVEFLVTVSFPVKSMLNQKEIRYIYLFNMGRNFRQVLKSSAAAENKNILTEENKTENINNIADWLKVFENTLKEFAEII